MSLFKDKTLMITGETGSFGNVVLENKKGRTPGRNTVKTISKILHI